MRTYVCTAALLCSSLGYSQQFFPFNLDQDHLTGAPDASSLNHPLAPGDQLKVCGEHFCRASDGSRVRMFGVNFAFGANFPEEADAPKIAKRLRRLGVNLVRCHHMDTSPDRDPANARSLLTTGPYPTLNPVSVKRLRAFLDALKAEGIYVDLNLHVGYTFRPDVDHVPALAKFPTQSKPLHILYPRMVDLQCEYTRKVIQALNLRNDPVLGVVEINNESSLIYSWQTNQLDTYLTGEYRRALQDQWNAFLKTRYATTEKLRNAWGASTADGPDLLLQKWALELHNPSQGKQEAKDGAEVVRLSKTGGSAILKQVGFSIDPANSYIAEVEIRADLPDGASRGIRWDVKHDVSPWEQIGARTIMVTNQWQKVWLPIQQPACTFDRNGRFGLELEDLGTDTAVYIRNACIRVAGHRGLDSDESLEAGNVALVTNEIATRRRQDDYLTFLTDVDRRYLKKMLAAVRETAGGVVPVAGTQVRFGGLENYDSHQDLDFQDNHFYVDHYNFPHTAWDSRDWRQKNVSAIATGLTELVGMAIERQAGRPYTVSEYNQPWPNMQANEIDVVTAALGAFQDWDALMHFAYSHAADWTINVPSSFNLNGDWSKDVLLGQAAWLFRSGAIQAGKSPVVIPLSADLRLRALRERANRDVPKLLGVDAGEVFVHPVKLAKDGEGTAMPAVSAPYEADSGDLTYDPDGKLYLIHAPQAAGVLGFAGTRAVKAGPLEVQLAASARGYATILLTALDGKPIEESRHLLLTTPGYTTRANQRIINYPGTTNWWTLEPDLNSNKPSGDLNRGAAPVMMERVESTVRLATKAQTLRVYPLSETGSRLAPIPSRRNGAAFAVHLQAQGDPMSPWYEICVE